jgi:hypothetical protein
MEIISDALAKYIEVLSDSLSRTSHAQDRPKYTRHLAQAAVLFM